MEVKTLSPLDETASRRDASTSVMGEEGVTKMLAKSLKRKRNHTPLSMMIIAVSLKLMLLIITALLALYVYNYALESESFNLGQIRFRGNKNLDVKRLEAAIRSESPENILRVDLRRLQARIEAEPWVSRAEIRRLLPNALHITVQERTPAAIAELGGELYVIDQEGVILAKSDPKYGKFDLPILKGLLAANKENSRQENLKRAELFFKLIADLDSTGMEYSKRISEVDLTNPKDAVLIPIDDTVAIHLGDSDFLKRYQMFLANLNIYEGLKQQYGNIEAIDLRFDNQIICRTGKSVTNINVERGKSTLN